VRNRSAVKASDNSKVVRWFHALVEHQLIPLQATYPFRAMTVDDRGQPDVSEGG
jgi:hypothetical protein